MLAIILNWRIDLLTLAYASALMSAMADCSNFILLFISKVVAVCLAYMANKLARIWEKEGYLKDLEVFTIDEDKED